MRLRRETSLGIGTILTIQILLSLLVIALLTRMGPAIEHILEENVVSEEAVEQMLAELAVEPGGGVPDGFRSALERAWENVSEEEERPLLDTVERGMEPAFTGDVAARTEVVAALRDLGRVNRESMARADDRAKSLGEAGAWAAAMLGAVALGLGIFVYRRILVRLERPVERLYQTVESIRGGNFQARCAVTHAPRELQQIAAGLNWILDRRLEESTDLAPSRPPERETEVRRVLGWLLDRQEAPTAVFDADGVRVAANAAAMDHAVAPDAPDDAADADEGADDGPHWRLEDVPGTSLRVGTLSGG